MERYRSNVHNPSNLLTRGIGAFRDAIYSWRREMEVNALAKKAVRKLLCNIKTGGFVFKDSLRDFLGPKEYWVYLKSVSGERRYVVAGHTPKSWRDQTFRLLAIDNDTPEGQLKRSLFATMEPNLNQKITEPVSKWYGGTTVDVSLRSGDLYTEEGLTPLPREERINFL